MVEGGKTHHPFSPHLTKSTSPPLLFPLISILTMSSEDSTMSDTITTLSTFTPSKKSLKRGLDKTPTSGIKIAKTGKDQDVSVATKKMKELKIVSLLTCTL
jgi:hypothetical protein